MELEIIVKTKIRDGRNFDQLKKDHYRSLSLVELERIIKKIFDNGVESLTEDEIHHLLHAYRSYPEARAMYEFFHQTGKIVKSQEQSDFFGIRKRRIATEAKYFLNPYSTRSNNPRRTGLYTLEFGERQKRAMNGLINERPVRSESLASGQSAVSSRSSSRSGRISFYNYTQDGHSLSHAQADPAQIQASNQKAGQETNQAQAQEQSQPSSEPSSGNFFNQLQQMLPTLLAIAGGVLLGQEVALNIPAQKQGRVLRQHGEEHGQRNFADAIEHANANRPLWPNPLNQPPVIPVPNITRPPSLSIAQDRLLNSKLVKMKDLKQRVLDTIARILDIGSGLMKLLRQRLPRPISLVNPVEGFSFLFHKMFLVWHWN